MAAFSTKWLLAGVLLLLLSTSGFCSREMTQAEPPAPGDEGYEDQDTQAAAGCLDSKNMPLPGLVQGVTHHRGRNRVWMSIHEQSLIESYLRPAMVMLEYGSGFSTMWYSQFVSHYYSVEHNQQWGKTVEQMLNGNSKVTYRVVPEKPYTPEFKKYIEMPASFGVQKFDVVLVDGRERVNCAKFILQYIDEKSVVLLHDYWMRTDRYGEVLKYYNVIAAVHQGQSLVVLKRKKNHPPVTYAPPDPRMRDPLARRNAPRKGGL